MTRPTKAGPTRPLVTAGSLDGSGGSLVGPVGSGLVPTSTGSNTWLWLENVRRITANGSNTILGPFVNVAAGSNIVLTVDQFPASTPSNTLRIHATGGGGSALTVQDEGTPLATDATTLNFVGSGVTATGAGATKTITIPGGSGSGALTFIDDATVGAGGAATVTIGSIPNTYKDLVIVGRTRTETTSDGEGVPLRVGNGSVDTGTNYQQLVTYAGWTSGNATANNFLTFGIGAAGDADANSYAIVYAEIHDYASSADWRGYLIAGYVADANGSLRWNGGGVWKNAASVIDVIGFFCTSGDIAEGSYFAVYGRG